MAQALKRAGYSGTGVTLVVGVSGGPDSCALLRCLHRLSQGHRLRLHVAHLNHDFRGQEADDDADFVSALADELGLPSTVEERDALGYQQQRRISSFEQAARELRYAFLREVAAGAGADAVAVGHTADDLSETVLLHILRGAGLHGLRGMPECAPWPWPQDNVNLRLFRPLLQTTKDETADYCRALNQAYRDDSGNYLPRFTRNRVRRQLLPLLSSEFNPRVRESLARLARTAGEALDYLEEEAGRIWAQVAVQEAHAVRLPRSALGSVHVALQKLLLRRAYAHLAGSTKLLTERNLDAMVDLARGRGASRTLDLPGGLKIHQSYDFLELTTGTYLPCPFPKLESSHTLRLPLSGQPDLVADAGPWRVTMRTDQATQPSFVSRVNVDNVERGPVIEAGRESGIINQERGRDTPSTPEAWSSWLDLAALGPEVHVRIRRPGDRLQPLGMEQEKKLQDFFTDARVPRHWRDRVPLVVAPHGIAWVVGYRIANWARVEVADSGLAEVVKITFELQM